MSSSLSSVANNSQELQNVLNSISNTSITNLPMITNNTSANGWYTSTSHPFSLNNLSPVFKMEFYKSENGGFVLNLVKSNPDMQTEKPKLFILNDVENIGKDIQNILLVEILKQ